jgi:hypothetical protein
MRVQVARQRREILRLQRAGNGTASAEALLERMLTKIDGLVAEREPAQGSQGRGKMHRCGCVHESVVTAG